MRRFGKTAAALALFFPVILLTAWAVGRVPGEAVAEAGMDIRRDGVLDFLNPEGRVLKSIAVEIAETPEAQVKGLMWRRRLDDSVGMLFIYDRADIRRFWMRNTPRSLDMIFVSEQGAVINIERETEPMSDRSYFSIGPAAYVVEVVAGFSHRCGIEPGTRIQWRRH